MKINDTLLSIENDSFLPIFRLLYGEDTQAIRYQKERYIQAVKKFSLLYPDREDIKIFSAPGRTEIGGNHTDHQHGCVLAAAVNLDVIAVTAFHKDRVIRIMSEGYDFFTVALDDLCVHPKEHGTVAIVRGIVSGFYMQGIEIGGFDMYCTSDVLSGSGISSSAAFETLISTIINCHYNNKQTSAIEIAKIGQFTENVYFGKKSGLMDQMVCSTGGLAAIDFHDTNCPHINSFQYDFENSGYCLCITDTKGSHANLTDDYIAVPTEMESIALQFGKQYLRDVDESDFYAEIPNLRKVCSDRAILRAAHFFAENNRAQVEARSLCNGNIDHFLELVNESGDSSATLLQNLYSCSSLTEQAIPIAIMISRKILKNKGAVRVHGGGFAGTIQAFVPLQLTEQYIAEMNRVFGNNSCLKLRIRPVGGIEITE